MTGYGIDVAVRRADDLDRKFLNYLETKNNLSVLDIGCGAGGQSFRMVKVDARVCGIDIHDFGVDFQEFIEKNNLFNSELEFICGDIRNLQNLISGREFDVCIAQRVIHYVTYQEAMKILRYLRSVVKDKLFISATGLNTYLKDYYVDKGKIITDRFCGLDEEGSKKFQITNPLCLYTKEEFQNLLISTDWQVDEIWVSAFGNIKAVCS